ncbi:hypothetical protein ACIQFL_09230 [Bacillus toyonensis]|uniref:hypothetical protein n=1 Tax=Bacillus toyonensis TaxID=155322 RepID=UPI00380EEDE8
MKERTQTILLFVSVIIMMLMFMYQMWDNLFNKSDETRRIEREREERRIVREEWLKDME